MRDFFARRARLASEDKRQSEMDATGSNVRRGNENCAINQFVRRAQELSHSGRTNTGARVGQAGRLGSGGARRAARPGPRGAKWARQARGRPARAICTWPKYIDGEHVFHLARTRNSIERPEPIWGRRRAPTRSVPIKQIENNNEKHLLVRCGGAKWQWPSRWDSQSGCGTRAIAIKNITVKQANGAPANKLHRLAGGAPARPAGFATRAGRARPGAPLLRCSSSSLSGARSAGVGPPLIRRVVGVGAALGRRPPR